VQRNYESMLIIRPDIGDEEQQEISNKIIKKIESLQGKISAAKAWAKERNFFYPLKSRGAEKKKYLKGCYWLVNFLLDKDKIVELKEALRLEERILRSIVISKEGKIAALERQTL